MAEIRQIAYREAGTSLRREIALLQDRAYGPSGGEPVGSASPLHDPALDAQSFLLRVDGRLASYAGVVTTTIDVDGEQFRASGLSCVATDPDFARQGLASKIVAVATRHMAVSGVDLGVFTCAPDLRQLYTAAGDWQVEQGVTLIGSRHPDALTSTALGVLVLMRLFSARADENARSLRTATIDLGLPVGQFW